jgi:hypothetical protein
MKNLTEKYYAKYPNTKQQQVIVLYMLFILSYSKLPAQENEEPFRHRLTVMMANSHIPSAGKVDGQSTVFIVPTWGVNYDYWFTSKWAIGLHNDFILQQYKIEVKQDKETIERTNPVAICAVALFRPSSNLTLLLGAGRELEKHESFSMVTIGSDYGIELPRSWELSFNLIYDNKFNAYDSWMFGIGFSKLL